MNPIKVYLIDDHDAVRQALMARLRTTPGILVVGETGEAEAGLLGVKALRPEVVIIETKRADGRGLEIVSWIAQSGLGAKIVVLTSYPSEWERWAAHRAGAALYLLKDIGSPQLVEQVRSVVSPRPVSNLILT
ncbi:MAG TPA: response regulator transcription factor [Anaerolineales bacterium]|nr:response regulator transcription factor [Anaerolineales bacterium]